MGWRRKKSRGLLALIFDAAMFVLTLGVSVALLSSYLSPYVNPSKVWFFAFFGLFFFVLYLANFILGIYWLLRRSRVLIICGLLLLLGLGKISSFYKFPFGKSEETAGYATLKVLTYNVAVFRDNSGSGKSTYDDIFAFVRAEDPDVICFQEFSAAGGHARNAIDNGLSRWKYKMLSGGGGDKGIRLAIFSKYPLVSHGEMNFKRNDNAVIYADMLIGSDTVRVVNSHLHITHVDRDNVNFIDGYNFTFDDEAKTKLRQIAQRLKQGFSARSVQADSMAAIVGSRDIPTVVCGDFNDTPMSYAYRTIRGGYRDAFVDKGRGSGFTYKQLYRMLRIDYILHSGSMTTMSYDSPDKPWSDHNPVIATIALPTED